MARVLIVGCGCRGRELAALLREDGHAVRGTTRSAGRLPGLEAAGVEGVVADPDRLGTLLPALAGVSVVCWLMGDVDAEPVHGARLRSLLDTLVDTPVRGVVYEAVGAAPPPLLEAGAALVEAAGRTHRMPVAVVNDADRSASSLRAGVETVLNG